MKRLIVTADDFGLCPEVNQAVIEAHRDGILTCASLMVAGDAAGEAVRLAQKHPSLKVGLHLVLVDGTAVLPPKEIPDLVDGDGRFSSRLVPSGIRWYFSAKIRGQLARECEAQIRKFQELGLAIDHLNSHAHQHIHPAICDIVLPLVRKYKIPAVRLPRPRRGAPNPKAALIAAVMAPWVERLRCRLVAAGIPHNQQIFGLHETGAMVEAAWLAIIPRIGRGITEVYCHPAVERSVTLEEKMPRYDNQGELAALTSPLIREELDRRQLERIGFSALS